MRAKLNDWLVNPGFDLILIPVRIIGQRRGLCFGHRVHSRVAVFVSLPSGAPLKSGKQMLLLIVILIVITIVGVFHSFSAGVYSYWLCKEKKKKKKKKLFCCF